MSESDSDYDSVADPKGKRPPRSKNLPAKLRDVAAMEECHLDMTSMLLQQLTLSR